ncbi:outer membrane protein [Geothrix campi]|uniref:outer membrane protein n=1 Tax=Geothrix campi TaxID=2966450 RepID=UPI0021475DE2|nr:porin family protein [Geothrix sp. SG10]
MRFPALPLLLVTAALALPAQENPGGNRFGIGLAVIQPTSEWGSYFDPGFQAGIQVHFNRESRFLSRLRIDYLRADSSGSIQRGLTTAWNGSTWVTVPNLVRSRMEAYTVAYEWMPHLEDHSRSGLFGILGVGGTLWNETRRGAEPGTGTDTDTEWSLTFSAGAGWRFNPHATLELRYVHGDMSSFWGHRVDYGPTRALVSLGTSLRF